MYTSESLEHVNMLILKKNKVVDGIKVAIQLTLKQGDLPWIIQVGSKLSQGPYMKREAIYKSREGDE